MTPEELMASTSMLAVGPRIRRRRRYPDSHWRARIAAWLRRLAEFANPLEAA